MSKVEPLHGRRKKESPRAPVQSFTLIDRAMAESTPGQALRAIMLGAKRLGWQILFPIPPAQKAFDPTDEVVGLVCGRAAYVGHLERTLGKRHAEAYRVARESV